MAGAYLVYGFQASDSGTLQREYSSGHYFDVTAAGIHWIYKDPSTDNRSLMTMFAAGWE